MRNRSVFMFAVLFAVLIFFLWINITFFWGFVALIVAFAYFVAIRNWLGEPPKKQ